MSIAATYRIRDHINEYFEINSYLDIAFRLERSAQSYLHYRHLPGYTEIPLSAKPFEPHYMISEALLERKSRSLIESATQDARWIIRSVIIIVVISYYVTNVFLLLFSKKNRSNSNAMHASPQ